MEHRNKIALFLFFISLSFCILSCTKRADPLELQTTQWVLKEFGEKTVIHSITPIKEDNPEKTFWRVSLLDGEGKTWEGIIDYTVSAKTYRKLEISLKPKEEP